MGLPEDLAGTIPDTVLHLVPSRFDVIGDIAVLSLPVALQGYGKEIAETIIEKRRNINTVLNKVSMVGGEKRLASYEVLAGPSTITTHREYGTVYRLDVSRVFYNPALASERNRVTSLVRPGEMVLVPFAGIGPFAIPPAKRGSYVVAIENNPDALVWFFKNIRLNNVVDRVRILDNDARNPAVFPSGPFDRAIVPAPYGMDTIIDVVSPSVRKGGMIHVYTFKKDAEIPGMVSLFRNRGLDTVFYRKCGNVAPGVRRFVFDLIRM